MDTSNPSDTLQSSLDLHDTSSTSHHPRMLESDDHSECDVRTPTLTGPHLATITSYSRGGRGVISRGEPITRRGCGSRLCISHGDSSEYVVSCGRGKGGHGRGSSSRDVASSGRRCGHGIDVTSSSSPFKYSLGIWEKS